MLKDWFRIPRFASDDQRRKRLLDILLLLFSGLAFIILFMIALFRAFQGLLHEMPLPAFNIATLMILFNGILFTLNRSAKVPGWLGGIIFIGILMFSITRLDVPHELYSGASLVLWLLPIMLAALIIHPAAGTVVAGMVSGLIFSFSPKPNYYAMMAFLMLALFCWLLVRLLAEALRENRRQATNIEIILNTVKDGVLMLDQQGNYVSANRTLLKMIPEDKLREMNSKPLEETLEWKRTVFSVTASSLPDFGSVVIFRDETRRHETDRAKDALLATTSHELRTPLGSIMNYIELLMLLLELDQVNSEKFTTYLTRAHENSRRLLGLINNILDQAQIQAGDLHLKQESCNLAALFERTRQLLASQIREKDLFYRLIIDDDVPEEIISDPERLNQVLNNLIGNAIKFTHQGGVTIKVSRLRLDALSIEVADTGPGIPHEQLPDVFEVFRRGSNYVQREHQGAGLGLSIVKELVTRMGGEISVASTLGQGTVFTLFIPLKLLPTE